VTPPYALIDGLSLAGDVLLGLSLAGAPFLIWRRSAAAALLGAAGGAAYTFGTVLLYAQTALLEPGRVDSGTVALIADVVRSGRVVALFGCMAAMVLVLARRAPATKSAP
jgi:hypothetical protein